LPKAAPGRAAIVLERPGHIVVDVHCDTPQLLVVAESFHPGWKCAVDEKPRRLHRINGDFLGCVARSGDCRVVLDFEPASLNRGQHASLIGLGLVACCLVTGCFPIGWRGSKLPLAD
jgi:uncharacterized membrane protein YfhO